MRLWPGWFLFHGSGPMSSKRASIWPIELATTDKTLTVREEDGELLMNSVHKPMYRTVFKTDNKGIRLSHRDVAVSLVEPLRNFSSNINPSWSVCHEHQSIRNSLFHRFQCIRWVSFR
jgi:hypothetical protein